MQLDLKLYFGEWNKLGYFWLLEAPECVAIEDSLYIVTDGNNYVPGFLYRLDPVKGNTKSLLNLKAAIILRIVWPATERLLYDL